MTASPTFSYWDSDDFSPVQEHLDHWRASFPAHRIIGRDEARAVLTDIAPEAADLFDRIRIPASRSDLARLALLSRYGGLYVDTHCRAADPPEIHRHLQSLKDFEMVVSTRWAPNYKKIMPYNGTLFARQGSPTLKDLLFDAIGNLAQQDWNEARLGFQPYHVWSLSGPGVLWNGLFDTDRDDGCLSAAVAMIVKTVFETENPVERHVFTNYRVPGAHWSERQRTERLFARPEELTNPQG